MTTIGISPTLLHNRHRLLLDHPPARASYQILPELSLYKAQGYLHFFKKDQGIEIFRGVFFLNSNKVQLLHSYNRVVLNRKAWVIDVEHVQRLFPIANWLNQYKGIILRQFFASSWCRAILPWSQFCERQLKALFPQEKIQRKMQLLYPGVSLPKRFMSKDWQSLNLLFVGHDFLRKGGHWALESFRTFSRKNKNVRLTIISRNVPDKYQRMMKELPGVFWHKEMSPKALDNQIYPSHNVLLFPTRYEAFGLTILEAMSHGLTVISTDIGAIPEMIRSNKEGFLIHLSSKYHQINNQYFTSLSSKAKKIYEAEKIEERPIKQIISALTFLKNNKNILKMIAAGARERVKISFSLQKERTSLTRIYHLAERIELPH